MRNMPIRRQFIKERANIPTLAVVKWFLHCYGCNENWHIIYIFTDAYVNLLPLLDELCSGMPLCIGNNIHQPTK